MPQRILLRPAFILFLSALINLIPAASAQVPAPALVGYLHNWQDGNAPYISPDNVDARYNIVDVAFAVPEPGSDYKMQFIPDQASQPVFISQIQTLQNAGARVLISVGGATAPISLSNYAERDTFIMRMTNILNTFGFDGMDIDFEGSSLNITGGTIAAPVDAPVINLIYAIKQIMAAYEFNHGRRMILTMAPETAYVQEGMSAYGGLWGAYLPVIDALRDSIEILHVQLYNSGSMYGIDGGIYNQGTADFIVAECEAVIHGFNTAGGYFNGLPAAKVAAGLPACANAAGGGYVDSVNVRKAINYLSGTGTQPGSYVLNSSTGYPNFRGLMTWSINWDAVASCNGAYSFAQTFENIYGSSVAVEEVADASESFSVFPNPTTGKFTVYGLQFTVGSVAIYRVTGEKMYEGELNSKQSTVNCKLSPGIYFVEVRAEGVVQGRKAIVVSSE